MHPTAAAPGWWFWGADEGEGGKLGDNQKVPKFFPDEVIDLSAGSRHSFIIYKDGSAFTTGFIESLFSYVGHLGVDDFQEGSNVGKKIDNVFVGDNSDNKIAAPPFKKAYAGAGVPSDSGEMHSMLIDEDGNVYTSGNNDMGQLCLGDRENRKEFSQVNGLPKPAVAGSILFQSTLILLEDGSVWGCGSNQMGELGLGPSVDTKELPTNVNELKNIKDMASGYKFAIFLDNNNVVYGTGGNIYGQQCYFTEGEPKTIPQILLSGVPGKVVQVAASSESSYFLFEDGTAVSCGRNDEGQLGDGTFINTSKEKTFVNVKLQEKIRKIGSGPSSQSVFFVTDNSVYGAGINDRFQLGINEIGSQEFPVIVDFGEDVEIDLVSASGTHTVASGNYL
jgi:alpha-tubulin suppressor-like RCC1 family protein